MKQVEVRELRARFRAQHGLITRDQARGLGITAKQERLLVERGEWERLGSRVLRLAASGRG
jgi:hypothetical protein